MSSKTYTVSNSAQLKNALNKAKGGDTISLKSGEYSLDIRDKNFDSAVTVTSADPENPAVLVRSTKVMDSSNITFTNLELTPDEPIGVLPNASAKAALFIRNSHDIKLLDSYVHSRDITRAMEDEDRNLYEDLPFGFGVRVSDSKDVVLSGNEITQLHKGIGLWNTENVQVLNNHLHHIRVDGIVGTDQRDTLIAENLFNSFVPYRKNPDDVNGLTDDHSDMIQYWGATAKFGIDGFTVKDNVFIQTEGAGNQTLYGRRNLRETDDPEAIELKNFEISGNLIVNGHKNAISIGDVSNVEIFNNTVIPSEIVYEDFRKIPTVMVTNNGDYAPEDDEFSLYSDGVQTARNISIYDNVLTYAFDPEVRIEAYNNKYNTASEVHEALDIDINGNNWLSSRLEEIKVSHQAQFKLDVTAIKNILKVSIDPQTSDLHGDKGSAYYTDAAALRALFNKLNTSSTLQVDTKLSIDDANVPKVQSDYEAPLVLNADASKESQDDDQDPQADFQSSSKASGTKLFNNEDVKYNFGVERQDGQGDFSGWVDSHSKALAHAYRTYTKEDNVILLIKVGTNTYEREFSDLDFSITRVLMVLDADIRNDKAIDLDLTDDLEQLVIKASEEAEADSVTEPVVKVRPQIEIEIERPNTKEPVTKEKSEPTTSQETSQEPEKSFFQASSNGKTIGTNKSDAIAGTTQKDFIVTKGGNDVVEGNRGHDKLYGNAGADTLDGGTQNDMLNGGSGADLLLGDYGRDTLVGGGGDDILFGGNGDDSLLGSGGKDVVVLGGKPEDYDITLARNWDLTVTHLKSGDTDRLNLVEAIYFQASDALYNINRHTGETAYVKPGQEQELYDDLRTLEFEQIAQSSSLTEAGTLTMLGSNANDVLTGTNDADIIKGLKGNDVIRGKDGDDLLIGNEGRDRMRGDDGDDMMLGGDGRDIIIGHRGDDLLLGGDGNDFISGASGRDIVVGGIGNDRLLGGSEIDTAVYSGSKTDYRITRIEPNTYKILDKDSGEIDILVDVERVYFENDSLLGQIRHSGWVKDLKEEDHSDDYAQFNLSNWANYTDEMVY